MSESPQPLALAPAQRRVLGVLIEKAKTTPAGYPMSVNALVAGCNQKQNRDPLSEYDAYEVEKALRDLERLGLVREIDWMGRVAKYRHEAYDRLGVDKVELAVLAELLLRGTQSLGDLRARAARMEPIADLDALRPVVERLVGRGLVLELTPPGRGQLVTHGLLTAPEQAASRSAASAAPQSAAPVPAPAPAGHAGLEQEVARLRGELARLAERVAELERRAAGPPR
jgi:hypothetical protein